MISGTGRSTTFDYSSETLRSHAYGPRLSPDSPSIGAQAAQVVGNHVLGAQPDERFEGLVGSGRVGDRFPLVDVEEERLAGPQRWRDQALNAIPMLDPRSSSVASFPTYSDRSRSRSAIWRLLGGASSSLARKNHLERSQRSFAKLVLLMVLVYREVPSRWLSPMIETPRSDRHVERQS